MPEAIPDLMRCPECGAGNPTGAGWCGQCLRRFDDASPEPRPEPLPGPPSQNGSAVATEQRPLGEARPEGDPIWVCPACEARNPLEANTCARCGTAFASLLAGPKEKSQPRVSGKAAVGLSAALPGLGHWVHREHAAAIARGLLWVWSVGIAILLLARPPAAARGLVRTVGAVFALGAAAIWLLSMLETMRFNEGDRRPLIPPKSLTWFTAGLSALLFAGLVGAVLAGR